jgi:hypothetical protein
VAIDREVTALGILIKLLSYLLHKPQAKIALPTYDMYSMNTHISSELKAHINEMKAYLNTVNLTDCQPVNLTD